MVVQRITSCSQKKKKKIEIYFFQKKKKKKKERKKKKSHFKKKIILFQKSSSLELRLDLILYNRGTQAALQRPGPIHPNNLREQSQNNVTKLFGCMLG